MNLAKICQTYSQLSRQDESERKCDGIFNPAGGIWAPCSKCEYFRERREKDSTEISGIISQATTFRHYTRQGIKLEIVLPEEKND